MFAHLAVVLLALVQGDTPPVAPSGQPPVMIAVVLPSGPNPSMMDALMRLRGEAASLGFEVRFMPVAPGGDPQAHMREIAEALSPAAVVAMAPNGDPGNPDARSVTLWFLDRATGSTTVRHLNVEDSAAGRADVVLAVRVLDFIRARMFDSLVTRRAERNPTEPAPDSVAAHETEGRTRLSAGVDMLGSFGGFPLSVLPSFEAAYAVRPWLRLGAGATGLGAQGELDGPPGHISIDQRLALAVACVQARTWWRLQPSAGLGVGAYHVSVKGVGSSGYLGHETASWTPALRLSAGLSFVVSPHVFVDVAGGALVLWHPPAIYSAGSEIAHTGRPAWQASARVGVAF